MFLFPDREPGEDELDHCRRIQRFLLLNVLYPRDNEEIKVLYALGISDWLLEELLIQKERDLLR